MKDHGSLFSGLDSFGLAASMLGYAQAFTCEIDPYCHALLKQHYPNAIHHRDITATDFTIHRGIYLLTGGDPCQPHSIAGSQLGTADARFLWPHMLRAVREAQPRVVVNENVAGSIGNGVVDTKISYLEGEGYTCWPPLLIPAGAGGAIHRRDRVFLVAYRNGAGCAQCNAPAVPTVQAEGIVWNNPFRSASHGYGARNPDKSTLLRMADGSAEGLDAASRNARIKAVGNSIDLRIAYAILSHLP